MNEWPKTNFADRKILLRRRSNERTNKQMPIAILHLQWQIEWKAWNVCLRACVHKLHAYENSDAGAVVCLKFWLETCVIVIENLDTIKFSNFVAHRCILPSQMSSISDLQNMTVLYTLRVRWLNRFDIRMILHINVNAVYKSIFVHGKMEQN